MCLAETEEGEISEVTDGGVPTVRPRKRTDATSRDFLHKGLFIIYQRRERLGCESEVLWGYFFTFI